MNKHRKKLIQEKWRKEEIEAAIPKIMDRPKIMDSLEAIIKVINRLCLHLPYTLFHSAFHWHVRNRKDSKCQSDQTAYVRWNIPLVWQNVMVILSCSTNFHSFFVFRKWMNLPVVPELNYQQSRLKSNFVSKIISSLEKQTFGTWFMSQKFQE